MKIQIADQRPALTIALSLARKLEDPRLPAWEAAMTTMVVEVTRKFFGALTDQQVRKGLDATIALLSVGLLASSEGGIDAEAWLTTLQAGGIQGVSKRTVDLVKRCDMLPEEDGILVKGRSAGSDEQRRTLLLRTITMDAGAGYSFLTGETARRETNLRGIELAEWLLHHTTAGRTIKKNVEDIFGFPHPPSEEVLSYLIPRLCGIADKLLPSAGADVSYWDGDESTIKVPPLAYSRAKKRYEELTGSVPPRLRPVLIEDGKDWFDRCVARQERTVKTVKKVPGKKGDSSRKLVSGSGKRPRKV